MSKASWPHSQDGEPTGFLWMRREGTGVLDVAQDVKCSLSGSSRIIVSDGKKNEVVLIFERPRCEEGLSLGGSVEARVSLEGSRLSFTVSKVETPEGYRLLRLHYPFKSFSLEKTDDGYIVWPHVQGMIIPTHISVAERGLQEAELLPGSLKAEYTAELRAYSGWNFTMPWYGMVKRGASWMAMLDTPNDAGVYINVLDPRNGMRLIMSPYWETCMKRLGYERVITYEFTSKTSYVAMARRFREYAVEKHWHRSLKEKMRENPTVERLLGAPLIKIWVMNRMQLTGHQQVTTTFMDAQRILEDMHEKLGVRRALILLAGWGPLGYDNVHPDIWPPGRWQGGLGELRKVGDVAKRQGYLFGLHDNYQDIYLDSPSMGLGESVVKTSEAHGVDNVLSLGGVWAGGQAFIVCSQCGLSYAQRNLTSIMKDLGPTAYFVDCTTSGVGLCECYDKDHPSTRSEDATYKSKLLSYLNGLGLVTGSEVAVHWTIPWQHYGEGVMSIEARGVTVPLFNLVYHDATVAYWHQGSSLSADGRETKFLLDILYGNQTNWTLDKESYAENREEVKRVYEAASKLHERVGTDDMTDHVFLTEDYLVQETRFESGVRVLVNFGRRDYVTPEGEMVKARSYLIREQAS